MREEQPDHDRCREGQKAVDLRHARNPLTPSPYARHGKPRQKETEEEHGYDTAF
jgi:hypothetical protein